MSDQDIPQKDPSAAIKKAKTAALDYRYCCEIDVTFPTPRHAQQVMRVLQVDQEIGDRATKTFSLCSAEKDNDKGGGNDGHDGENLRVLRM